MNLPKFYLKGSGCEIKIRNHKVVFIKKLHLLFKKSRKMDIKSKSI